MGKRVLMVDQNSSVPKDVRVLNEAKSLTEHGYNVSVLCLHIAGEAWYESVDNVKIYRCFVPTAFSGFFGYVFEYAWTLIIWTLVICVLYVKDRYDVIQICNPPDLFFHIGWLCKLVRKRFVYDQHDLCPELLLAKFPRSEGLLYKLAVWFERATHSTADAVICTNTSYAELAMERHNVSIDKLWVVRNGPKLDDYEEIEEDRTLKGNHNYMVVYGGRIAEQDGADVLIKAVHKIVHGFMRRDIFFAVLGDGPALKSVKQLAEDLGVSKWIHFTGWVDHSVLIKYFKSADVCISPEPGSPLNDKSTLVKVIEYVACGKPVVAYALKESMVTAGEAAVYVDKEKSIDELAKVLLEVLDDPNKRMEMQEAAIARRDLLSWRISEKVLLNAYDSLFKAKDDVNNFRERHGWDSLVLSKFHSVREYKEVRS